MVVHLWGKYWMAAWRGGRTRVWVTGAITFLVAVPCALTGYVSQQNFDAQWISTQAKDAMNSVGVGAFFNLTNFGQMYSYHILLLPLAVTALVIAHVLLVRRHGVVPPFRYRGVQQSLALGRLAASASNRPGALQNASTQEPIGLDPHPEAAERRHGCGLAPRRPHGKADTRLMTWSRSCASPSP